MADENPQGTATDTPSPAAAPIADPYLDLNEQERDYIKSVDEQLGVDPTKTKTTARQRLEWNLAAEEKINERRNPPKKSDAPAAAPVKKEADDSDPDDKVSKLEAKIDALSAAIKETSVKQDAEKRQALFEKAIDLECKTYDGLTPTTRELVKEAALLGYLTNPNVDPASIVRQKIEKLKVHDTERGKAYVAGKLNDRKAAGESAGGRTPATKTEKPKADDLESGRLLRRLQVEAGQR